MSPLHQSVLAVCGWWFLATGVIALWGHTPISPFYAIGYGLYVLIDVHGRRRKAGAS